MLNYLNFDRMEEEMICVSGSLILTVAFDTIELVRDPLLIDTVIMLLINESPPKRKILLLVNVLRSVRGYKA